MNPLVRVWLAETLKKAGAAGGMTALEEAISTLPRESVCQLRDLCQRVLDRGKVKVEVVGSPRRSP